MRLFQLSSEYVEPTPRQKEIRRHRIIFASATVGLLSAVGALGYAAKGAYEKFTAPVDADCELTGIVPVTGNNLGDTVRHFTTVDDRGPLGNTRDSIQLTVQEHGSQLVQPGEDIRLFVCGANQEELKAITIALPGNDS